MTAKTKMSCLLACGLLALSIGSANAQSVQLDGAKYLPMAKVTLAQAKAIALKAFPGKVVAEELEKESGGSGLRYSFDIRKGKVLHEVGVDAKTGKVLENSIGDDD